MAFERLTERETFALKKMHVSDALDYVARMLRQSIECYGPESERAKADAIDWVRLSGGDPMMRYAVPSPASFYVGRPRVDEPIQADPLPTEFEWQRLIARIIPDCNKKAMKKWLK